MLKILGRVTSINVRKVTWAAAEVGVASEREEWGLPLRDPKVPEFMALNPNGQVPVIIDDGFVLWESNAILLYLGEKYGRGGVLPADIQQRALVQQWLVWQATELGAYSGYPVHALIRKTPGYEDPAKLADAIVRWTRTMEILEGQLAKGNAYVAGSDFSIADIAVGLTVHRWFSVPIERKALPAVAEYYERVKARPAGAEFMTAATP